MIDKLEIYKEVWIRSDAYFEFKCDKTLSLGKRLKTWREINCFSISDMAMLMYYYRRLMGLENDKLSEDVLNILRAEPHDLYSWDRAIETKKKEKREKRIKSLARTYRRWENMDFNDLDTPLSLNNLYVLKHIIGCDYEFLFCESDSPHRLTDTLVNETGLNFSSIEKLLLFNNFRNRNESDSLVYEYFTAILQALDTIVCNEDFMYYLSYYLSGTRFDTSNESMSLRKYSPFLAVSEASPRFEDSTFNSSDLNNIYLLTLSNKLYNLRQKNKEASLLDTSTPKEKIKRISKIPFSQNLKQARADKGFTQTKMSEQIQIYKTGSNVFSPDDSLLSSTLRTYQNWESKGEKTGDFKLSINDLIMLKNILDCDYDFLFGETTIIKQNPINCTELLGLSPTTLMQLAKYKTDDNYKRFRISLNLVISDEDLLNGLAYYLSDNLWYQTDIYNTDILKPCNVPPELDSTRDINYRNYLFNEYKDLNNIFLPSILNHFTLLKKRYLYNEGPINDLYD